MTAIEVECLELNLQVSTEFFGRFLLKPLEAGHGLTIGTIFRRVLLTRLSGLSIVGVRIAGVTHEFSTLPGIREDVMELIQNLKDIVFTSQLQENSIARLKIKGPSIVTASCFNLDKNVQILNPNQYVATIVDNSFFEMEAKLEWGQGYKLAEEQVTSLMSMDFLPMDAVFMPVTKVTYYVEKLGTDIDSLNAGNKDNNAGKEQITLDIWTNGSITPNQAIIEGANIINSWFDSIKSFALKEQQPEIKNEPQDLNTVPLEELHLSVRAFNGLKRGGIESIGALQTYKLKDLKKIKNLGQKSITEIAEKLKSQYGIILS